MLELKIGCSTRVQTEMVEFIALPFQSSKKKKKKLVISRGSRARTAKECTNKRDAHAELCLAN